MPDQRSFLVSGATTAQHLAQCSVWARFGVAFRPRRKWGQAVTAHFLTSTVQYDAGSIAQVLPEGPMHRSISSFLASQGDGEVFVKPFGSFSKSVSLGRATSADQDVHPALGLCHIVKPLAMVLLVEDAPAEARIKLRSAIRCPEEIADRLFIRVRQLITSPPPLFYPSLPTIRERSAELGSQDPQQCSHKADDSSAHEDRCSTPSPQERQQSDQIVQSTDLLCTKSRWRAPGSVPGEDAFPADFGEIELTAGGVQEVILSRPKILECLGRKVCLGVRRACSSNLPSTLDDGGAGLHRAGRLRHQANSNRCCIKSFLVWPPFLIEERHEHVRYPRMRNSCDLGAWFQGERDVLAIRGRELAVGGKTDVSPLTCMLAPPGPILVASSKPSTQQDTKQRDGCRRRGSNKAHRCQLSQVRTTRQHLHSTRHRVVEVPRWAVLLP